jgi:hypothetical protein
MARATSAFLALYAREAPTVGHALQLVLSSRASPLPANPFPVDRLDLPVCTPA